MLAESIGALLPAPARAVVINVGTELVTTLALLSAVRYADMPVLLINCTDTSRSREYFDALARRTPIDIVNAPLQPHGKTLDALFAATNDDVLLLLDSDAEICDADWVPRLRRYFDHSTTFGAGFLNGPEWLSERHGAPAGTAMLHERPWMPSVFLRVAHVREALDAGASFRAHVTFNDFAPSGRISRLMAARFDNSFIGGSRLVRRLPQKVRTRLGHATLPRLAWLRGTYYGHRPNFVWCDTGTDVFQYCRYKRGLVFAGLHVSLLDDEVRHYQGVTRHLLKGNEIGATALNDVEVEVIDRLATAYDFDWPAAATAAGLVAPRG
ncbi:MAG: hypothetical protein QOJ98_1745 [Acidobacteriota bacterium]|nr:hypothetical protein [Acidobacteriota bacterium]